jgi:hypothetical protein
LVAVAEVERPRGFHQPEAALVTSAEVARRSPIVQLLLAVVVETAVSRTAETVELQTEQMV